MGLDLGQALTMMVRWLIGLAFAIGFVVLVAWLGDRLYERLDRDHR
jgi:flagellar biogenesis protein FliO